MDSDSWSDSDSEENDNNENDSNVLGAEELENISTLNLEDTIEDDDEELFNAQVSEDEQIFLSYIDKCISHYQITRPAFQDVTPAFVDGVPFLVDGDSLLLTMMYDKNWSSQLGGSSLHLVYLFERYLNIFVERGGTFYLIFFKNWRNIWDSQWNILLYRSILISHFSKNVQKYPVHIFENCFDTKFIKLISTARPGFILTNFEAYEQYKELFKTNNNIIKHIMNINLLIWLNNDLPCIDTNYINVDISIIQGFYLDSQPLVKKTVNRHIQRFTNFIKNIPKIEEVIQIPKCIEFFDNFDIREASVLTSAYFFHKHNNNENILKIFFVNYAIMKFFNLKNRCCPKFITPLEELEKIVNELHKCMFFAISILENKNFNYTLVSDLWQGLLFGHICRFVSTPVVDSKNLGSEIAEIYENIIQNFNNFGFSIKPYPIQLSNDIIYEFIESENNFQSDLKSLIPINNPLMLTFCGDILHDIKWRDLPKKMRDKIFSEYHHYHNMKVITDEHDHVRDNIGQMPTDKWEQKWFIRSRAMHAKYMTLYGSSILGKPLETSGIFRNASTKPNKKEEKKKNSKKKQEILDAKMQKDAMEQEKKDKKIFDEIKEQFKKFDVNYEKLLGHIDLVLKNKTYCLGSYKIETLILKLKVMREILKLNKIRKLEMEKSMFLTIRDILYSNTELSTKNKTLLSKCLTAINCTEIINRNRLSIQENSEDDNWIRFQLKELGPELIRETGGKPDPRVKNFIPDPWQSELFDIVDKKQSAFIVAPTSSGKTYASYYCMESVLKESTEGIVVYVAPTKALVNQVAATVYANFKDTKMPDGMSVYGIFTRDYRMYALTCQILITVPQCLEILLMSPRRHAWVKRLRYVIFDEVHCIQGNIGGASFERCLLLIRCPFLALSATIRNPEVMRTWLQNAENFKQERDIKDECPRPAESYKVNLVIHTERHSDLTKYTFGNGHLHHLHPYAELEDSVIRQNNGIPSHMTMSPAETLQLFDTMYRVYPECKKLQTLSPIKYFSTIPENGFISRNLVRKYASDLSNLLQDWFENHRNNFETTIRILKPVETDRIVGTGGLYIRENITDLIMYLKKNNMLPTLVFAYSRNLIKVMTITTTTYFENMKKTRPSKSSVYYKQKENIQAVKVVEDRLETKKYKTKALNSVSGNAQQNIDNIVGNRDYVDRKNNPRRLKKAEKLLYLISDDAPETLQGIGVIDSEDIKYIEQRLTRVNITSNHIIARSLKNGLCLHHGGLNAKIRGAVEMLFRKKFLNAVFATGTLALGIHMPCKTVVVAGNSAYLNSLEYHQMSGRAGRRGYDTAGNVIFFGLNPRKQHSLMTAKLPHIKGNFPVTVTLILRSLLLVSDVTEKGKKSEQAKNISISRILTMLEHSLCLVQDKNLKINIKHFFSFTLQLLKIQGFINENGEPLMWCGLATHLHYHEPGNLAFIYLLKTGIIRKICTETKDEVKIAYNLLTILSYLFTKVPLDEASKGPFYNSIVVLDPLPEIVYEGLENYNKEVRFVFEQYFVNVANYFKESDTTLPLSSINIVGKNSNNNLMEDNIQNKFLNMCVPKLICSSFAALSGNDDNDAYSEKSLITNLKEKMTTDVKVIPLIPLDLKINGYAVDFYRHETVHSIIMDNGIKEGAEFTLLTDFLLILKTIRVSLQEMGVKENDIVFYHFAKLAYEYEAIHSKAFGREHV